MNSFNDVKSALSSYAQRGIFKGLSVQPGEDSKHVFRIVWHYDWAYELVYDQDTNVIGFRQLLTNVSGVSPMARELRRFVKDFSETGKQPAHKKVTPEKARLIIQIRRGCVALSVSSMDGDMDYAA